MTRLRAIAALAGWVVVLVGALAVLHSTPLVPAGGRGADPALAVVTILRVVCGACGSYLLAVTVTGATLRLVGAARAAARVEAWAPPPVRRRLRQLAIAVAAASTVGTLPAGATTSPDEPVTMQRWLEEPAVATAAEDDAAPVMRRLPPDEVPESTGGPPDETPAVAAGSHVVRAGDHLWAVAEAALTAARGRPVTDDEVDPYWRAVVAANADVVVDPDLVFPGQILRVPPVPSAPAEV